MTTKNVNWFTKNLRYLRGSEINSRDFRRFVDPPGYYMRLGDVLYCATSHISVFTYSMASQWLPIYDLFWFRCRVLATLLTQYISRT